LAPAADATGQAGDHPIIREKQRG